MTQSRFMPLSLEQMSAEQRRIADRRMGSLGRLGAPLNVFIRSPATAERMEQLSDYFREGRLAFPDRLKELVIMTVARHWTAHYPWSVHYRMAVEAGVEPAALERIAAGLRPDLPAGDAVVYDFCKELLDSKRVGDPAFAAVVAAYGERGAADLIGLIGCYCTLCMALAVDRCPPVASAAPPLQALA